MKAKNIAILLFSAVIGCAVAKTYSSLQEEGGKTTDVRKERKTNVKKDVVSESEPTVEHETESVQAEVAKPSYGEYASSQKSGVVGLYGGNSIDNPEDNIFEVVIPSSFSSSDKVILSYDVEGVAGSTGVALSINDRTAMGGMVAYSSDKRSSVSEEIDAAWLVKGKNRIMFTLPDSANYGYRVSNLKIAISANTASGNIVATASKLDGEVYVRGFVKNAKAKSVNIAGKEYELTHGSFEALISGDDEDVRITCGDASKTFHATTVPGCIASTRLICVNKSEKQTQKEFSLAKKENNKVQDVAATLNVDSGVVKKDMKITMTNLRHKDLPALDLGMTNVTDGVEGYRFLPHGVHFDGEGAVVSLKYDRTKIPSGYTENDIRTYYFDLDTKHWVALKRDSIDKENNLIVSRTNHFTDMINGVIQAPESPETQGFTPTMMSDLKLADPTAKIQSIAPPTANNRGSANLSYNFEMPPARHGMQPSLGIQYNSDGGTGLLGEGWDLSVPTISVETRWGVPRYDDILETETYLMDGSMLVLDNGGVNYLAHRALNQIKRSEVKRTDGAVIFHPRKENSFSKIVRLGNSPAEYTWVVTDKSGTKYYYGKKNADGSMKGVLMGKNHEGKDVIAEWKLVRIQEVHGDWVEYEYEEEDDAVSTNVVAKTLYLSKITAGNSGEKAHTEVVVNKDIRKRKVQRMGNYGFLVSNPYLLKSVEIKYEGNVLRSYEFKYNHQAPFLADLLEKIIHKDANGDVVSENNMKYHDAIDRNGISFNTNLKPQITETKNRALDVFGKDEYKVLNRGVRMLGGTTSNTFSFNAYGGVGPTGNPVLKSLTVGGNFSYSHVTNHGVVSFTDIDGDGLADKVYKAENGTLYYQPYLPDLKSFGKEVEIDGISEISESTSSTTTFGGNANAIGGIVAGVSKGNVDSETTTYFSDVNGDGLVDLVDGSKVYFNRLVEDANKTNGDRKIAMFAEGSNVTTKAPATPNPIVSSLDALKNRDNEGIKQEKERLEAKQKTKIENSPMHDVIRVWEAPYAGSVIVSGNPTFAGTDNSDGAVVSVQYKNKYILNPVVLSKNNTTASLSKTLTVSKGDKIYFRVQSGKEIDSNGEGDIVNWQPVVTYSDSKYQTTDPNGLSLARFSSVDGFMLSSSTEGLIDTEIQRPTTLKLKINKAVTTDDVKVVVTLHNDEYYEKLSSDGETYESIKNNDYRKVNVVTYDFSAVQTISDEKSISLNEYIYQSAEHPLKYISCRLESSTNIDWSKVSLSAIVEYEKSQNEEDDLASLGVPVFIGTYTNNDYFGGWKTSYGENIEDETSYTVKVSETEEEERTISKADLIQKLELTPKINFETSGLNVSAFRMSFKNSAGELLGNIKLNHDNGDFTAIRVSEYPFLADWFAQETPESLWIEYYVDLLENDNNEDDTDPSFKVNSSGWIVEAYEYTEIEKTKIDEAGNEVPYTETVKNQIYESSISGLNVVSNRLDESFGPMYRGWGQFAYSAASDRYSKNIDETRLGASAYNDMKDGYDPENPESFEYDKDKQAFIVLQPDFINNTWNGQASYKSGKDIITNGVGRDLMIVARQGEQDVKVVDPFANINSGSISGGYGIGFPILSESSSKTKQYGALSVTANDSEGDSKTTQSFMDMNGDGYPDLIKGKEIFYTNQTGGLNGGTQYFKDIDLSDYGTSKGISYGSGNGAIHAIPSLVKAIKASHNNNTNAQEKSAEKSRANFSISGGWNNESTGHTKLDMNGDGLLDIVSFEDHKINVMLNLGYGFTPKINWGGSFIREGSSKDIGIGGGVDICGSSYSAGLNISGATSEVSKDLVDVNGDGLPDLLSVDTEKTKGAVCLNTGFGFGEEIIVDKIPSIGTSTSLNGSINGNATVGFIVWLVRISASGGAAAGTGLSGEELSLRDFDGDGYPDVVTSNSKNSIEVALSNIGTTNKLKSVTTPFGGRYELEYIHSTPTQQHPGGKWVMSKLTVTDTQRDINDCPPVVSVFDYSGGKRDRRERDFYGFAEVRTKRMNVNEEGNSVVESQIVQNYDTTNYYTSGTTIGSYVCDADQQQFFSKETTKLNMYDVSGKGNVTNGREVSATTSFDENGRYFVAPFESTTKRFEEDSETTTNIVENKYGNFGNLTEYKYTDGITNKSYTTTITYKDYDEETGVFGLPTDVEVKSGDQTMRHVSAEYDKSGYNPTSMTKIITYLGGETAEVEFKYDTLGNIIEKIMPEATGGNLMNKRMTYTYEYDKKHRMYPTRVTDGFGYRSDMFNYDYRYGIPLSVKDMNGFITEYEIDDLGRVTKVTAPNELSSGAPYTILYHYGDVDSLRYARTYHYDPQHPKEAMVTASIVDGLGRGYQVKKNAEVDGKRKMIVSGLTTFDRLGREIAHYAPSVCNLNDFGYSSYEKLTQLDEIKYDKFDRPVEQTAFSKNSDAYTTYTSYEIEEGKLKTHVYDKNGKDNILSVNTYSDGSEHTLKTVKEHTNENETSATTEFEYDGIGQLLSVKDPADKLTTYTYDMAGRKLSVDNLSAGKTTFTYDNLGNVLTKTTGKGDVVTYKYEYNRLVEQIYGNDKWKNNVKYTYGGVDAKHNRVGRLALVEDGSGAQEYFYGKMGEVEKIRRTIIIPGVDVATYTTEWKYDSWNRIQEMIYPDGEKIKYYYNLGGQLQRILGQKNYICTYIDSIRYDKYEQRSYIKYGNGTETTYDYDPVNRRLDTMTVSNKNSKAEGAKGLFLNNIYKYDAAGNITSVENTAALNSGIGGTMSHTYDYDDWYRLKTANGVFESVDKAKRAEYSLTMGYDNLYNITSKKLTMTQTNLQFAGTLSAGHEFNYTYSDKNPMQLASVETKQYNVDRTNMDPNDKFDPEQELLKNLHTQDYEFDDNGNMVSVSVAKNEEENPEGEQEATEEKDVLKSFLWDEENRLLAVNNNGSVSCYFYDAAGERTVKLTSESEMVHVNGKKVGGNANICKFTAYVSPYFVVSNGGAYTKHIYAASQRIASKLGNEDGFGADPRRVEMAGGKKISDIQKDNIGARYKELGFTYSAPEKEKVEKDSTMDSEAEEKLIFFYHPDHLGSTSYVTDADGNIAQHVEYIPYGEVFVEERNSQFSTNFLFNAKELDNETGLYYYGARYLDPTGAMWLSVDPMWEKYAGMTPYNYCMGNPVKLVDPDGRENKTVVNTGDENSTVQSSNSPAHLERYMGTPEYYEQRALDYEKRHPGEKAPDYYRDYGKKYCQAFLDLKNSGKLSEEGNQWVDQTLINLQKSMEKMVTSPSGAELETKPEDFKAFAYSTHAGSYIDAGVQYLSVSDLISIAMTPDLKDITTKEGLSQVFDVGLTCARQKVIDASNYAKQKVIDAYSTVKNMILDVIGDKPKPLGGGVFSGGGACSKF